MTDIDTIVQDLKDAQWKSNDEIERLKKYEKLVQFIANDYHELSHAADGQEVQILVSVR